MLRGIRALVAKGGVSVKINTVVMRDFNLNEISGLVRFAKENDVLLRFIEFMPLDKDVWSNQQYVSASEILSLLPDALQWSPSPKSSVTTQNTSSAIPNGPAKYFRNAKTGQDIGIISAVSDHFCHTCNRLRITSTGEVRPCLFSNRGVAIIDALRRKDPDAARDGILMAVKNKPHEGGTGIPEERQNPEDAPQKRTDLFQEERHMSRIGG